MRNNQKDDTLKKNYINKYQFLIKEYEEVKNKKHPVFKTAKAFYKHNGTCPQTFLKYYARYLQSGGQESALLPQKRGPKFKTRRTPESIEKMVLAERENGTSRYEINSILKPRLMEKTPSASTIYQILKRHGKNRLTVKMKVERRCIIKEKAGELAHIDCHHLSKDTIANDPQRYHLLAVVDSCTRIAWAEVMTDVKAVSALFATLHCFNQIGDRFDIRFAEALTDNGPEFGIKNSKSKQHHPFERLLIELDIKHRYTRPYRPQTNGKVERFWRTLNADLIEGTYFESIDHFKQELYEFLLYYNKLRPHQGIQGKTPEQFAKTCQRIT